MQRSNVLKTQHVIAPRVGRLLATQGMDAQPLLLRWHEPGAGGTAPEQLQVFKYGPMAVEVSSASNCLVAVSPCESQQAMCIVHCRDVNYVSAGSGVGGCVLA
jgi:hypothetical protein